VVNFCALSRRSAPVVFNGDGAGRYKGGPRKRKGDGNLYKMKEGEGQDRTGRKGLLANASSRSARIFHRKRGGEGSGQKELGLKRGGFLGDPESFCGEHTQAHRSG